MVPADPKGAIAGGLGLLLAAFCAPHAASAQSAPDFGAGQTIPAQRRCFVDTVRVSGFLAHRAEAFVLGGPEGYRIASVLVREGDTVSEDQELVRLEPSAMVHAAPVPGVPSGAPGQAPPAGRGPPPIVLKAPAAGVVTASTVKVGGLASARGEPLFRIATSRDLDLVVDMPSAYVARVREGGGAKVIREDGSEVPTTVRVPPAEIDARTQFARARLGIPSGSGLRPGMFGRAFVDTDESCGPSVPKGAILRQNNTTSVLVIRDGKLVARRVEIGLSSAEYVEIVSGLAEGQSVVANAAGAL